MLHQKNSEGRTWRKTDWELLAWEEHSAVRRFVQEHPEGASLEEIGIAMGMTGERVRQVVEHALLKLRMRLPEEAS